MKCEIKEISANALGAQRGKDQTAQQGMESFMEKMIPEVLFEDEEAPPRRT